MGKLINGINGPFTGKVGTVVGSSWKGEYYIKAKYKKRTPHISDKEKGNRSKFSMAQFWLKPLLDFVRVGFKGYSQLSEGFVAAKSYLMKNAMEGSGAETIINPALVKVSYGDLPLSENIAVKLIPGNQLQFTWNAAADLDLRAKDQVMLLAYDAEHQNDSYVAWTITGQFRSAGSDILKLPEETGHTYQVYAAFIAADRTKQSNSVYLGEVNV